MKLKSVPLDVLRNGASLIPEDWNMDAKLVALEVSSAGTDTKLVQFVNILVQPVSLAKFNFGIDLNDAAPLNKFVADVTFIVSNHGMVTKLLQVWNIEVISVKLRVFVKIGHILSDKQPLNVVDIVVFALRSNVDGNDSNW